MQVRQDQAPRDLAYVRFTLIGSGEQQVISINESLEAGADVDTWINLGKYVPDAWCKEIRSTVNTVNNIPLSDASTAIRFVFASDIHVDPDPSTSYTENLGKVCAEVMQSCDVPFFVTGGDNCTQSSGFMPTVFKENMDVLLDQLKPIPQKNILLSVGNHDGATGSHEINASIESVMPSSHLILCRPLLLLPPIPPSIRVFSNESSLRMRWPKELCTHLQKN